MIHPAPLVDASRTAAREIAETLAAGFPLEVPFALHRGEVGIALFLGYAGAVFEHEPFADAAEELLARATSGSRALGPSLFGGFTGLAWALEHMCGRVLAPNEDDVNEDTDRVLLELLRGGWSHRHEWMFGAVGVGVYAWERRARPSGAALLDQVLAQLQREAVHRDGGVVWPVPAPEEDVNLGFAHGSPGVIAWLARVAEIPALADRARSLLRAALPPLRATRLPAGADCVYPPSLGDYRMTTSRLAWCYGDLAIGLAFLRAARVLDDAELRGHALELLEGAARRDADSGRVRDASFCHGSAGIAHLFRRAHEMTGEPRFAEASTRWLADTLARRRPGEGCAGYVASRPESQWLSDASLLTGAAGIGLVLLGACSDLAPDWDAIFL